jgi:hypothetical protein
MTPQSTDWNLYSLLQILHYDRSTKMWYNLHVHPTPPHKPTIQKYKGSYKLCEVLRVDDNYHIVESHNDADLFFGIPWEIYGNEWSNT